MARKAGDWVQYYESVRRFQLQLCGGLHDLADDLTQETFLKVHRWGGDLKDTRNPRAYIRSIARNVASTHYQKKNHVEALEAQSSQSINEPDDPYEMASGEDDRRYLNERIEELSAADKKVIRAMYWEGMTCAEIGADYGGLASSAKTRLYRARKRLQVTLPPLD